MKNEFHKTKEYIEERYDLRYNNIKNEIEISDKDEDCFATCKNALSRPG